MFEPRLMSPDPVSRICPGCPDSSGPWCDWFPSRSVSQNLGCPRETCPAGCPALREILTPSSPDPPRTKASQSGANRATSLATRHEITLRLTFVRYRPKPEPTFGRHTMKKAPKPLAGTFVPVLRWGAVPSAKPSGYRLHRGLTLSDRTADADSREMREALSDSRAPR